MMNDEVGHLVRPFFILHNCLWRSPFHSGSFFNLPPLPAALRRDYREWLAGIAAHTASLVRRGIERAREMILLNDIDLDFAISETTGQVDEEIALPLKTAAKSMQRAH